MPSPRIVRNTLRAACLAAGVALAPSAAFAQAEVRVMPHFGMMPMVAVEAGGSIEVRPAGGRTSYFGEYNLWGWGLICVGYAIPHEQESNRCGEGGYAVHAGIRRHLSSPEARWRPYVAAAAGVSRVMDPYAEERPLRASLSLESGYDVGIAGPLTLRLGARWQGRPQVGTDYIGPVLGLGLRVGER